MKKIVSSLLAFTMLATSSVTLAGESEARGRRHHDGYYDNGYYKNGYYDRHHRRGRHSDGDMAAAAIVGLALGAIIVGSTTQRQRTTTYYYDDGYSRSVNSGYWEHVRRCESRYRSYDRGSDTFIGRDGRRYYCNL